MTKHFIFIKQSAPGLLENVYKTCLAYRLRQRGLFVEMERPVPVIFEEIRMECGYRADLVVERRLIVDTKTIEIIGEIQVAQILTYLRFLKIGHGLILNFNTLLLKNGIKEYLMDLIIQNHKKIIRSVLCVPMAIGIVLFVFHQTWR